MLNLTKWTVFRRKLEQELIIKKQQFIRKISFTVVSLTVTGVMECGEHIGGPLHRRCKTNKLKGRVLNEKEIISNDLICSNGSDAFERLREQHGH
jgi:hypothetical protein